jgi:Uma2 family endonuclease
MTRLITEPDIQYPDSDGKPMADNMLQFEWIVTIQGNLDLLFANDANVLVAGDNLIYPVKGQPKTCQAPDVYVAFGRPKGYRGSYKVFEEGGNFPQVIFEVLSPNNTRDEMARKRQFYERHGAEEYYVLDPERETLEGYLRGPTGLVPVLKMAGFTSPRLGVTFKLDDGVRIIAPGGKPFLTFIELGQLQQATARKASAEEWRAEVESQRAEQEKKRADEAKQSAEQEKQRAEQEKQRAEQEKQRAEQEKQRAEQEKQRAEKLAAKLRALGVDPDA